jgi:antagonist of KipI
MSLRVIAPGTHTLLVDRGRPGSRGLGVPVGGPADATSLMLGNALVGNAPLTPALEITLTGPTLVAEHDVGVGVFGAPFQVFRDGELMSPNGTITLRAGQTLRIGGTPTGCRAYLCVPGGFRAKEVLGSVTGFEAMKDGEVLECDRSALLGRTCAVDPPSGGRQPPLFGAHPRGADAPRSAVLRCVPGPQADWFDDAFFRHTYLVTPASSRMGIRLEGPPLKLPRRELVSEPVAPGAVQITNEGKPIVLGVDGQTIGGYPKVAHVISADLDALGQLRPGEEVRFHLVTERAAERAAAGRRETLDRRLRRIAVAIS